MRYLVTARVKPGREAALLKAVEEQTLGMGSVAGACAAGIGFGAIPKYFDSLSEGHFVGYDQFFIGVVALALVLWAPGGFADIGRRVWRRLEGSGPPPPSLGSFEIDVREAGGAAADEDLATVELS